MIAATLSGPSNSIVWRTSSRYSPAAVSWSATGVGGLSGSGVCRWTNPGAIGSNGIFQVGQPLAARA